ncbi:hypothetical protein AKJ44_02585 [candidate division MSBL1 archaeon SCGC-AAA261F17]|uniref:Uncharacterized protein n=1 Tax=candidate division MSBL1 archaeon SCGC-AAA261F17 TaxID=1698274 RepID=A0A133V4N8_9EURY|nr:hypothetical protein AKJ44_02585 [candidate division MSBL1 archaeon SCGC-AAA261F17]
MKILLVTEYFPENGITGGVEARSYYLSKHLAENPEGSAKDILTDYSKVRKTTIANGIRISSNLLRWKRVNLS